jgi:hypothetical protein
VCGAIATIRDKSTMAPFSQMTILDVRHTTTFTEHEEAMKRWAESVWQAWALHHETIRRWAGF